MWIPFVFHFKQYTWLNQQVIHFGIMYWIGSFLELDMQSSEGTSFESLLLTELVQMDKRLNSNEILQNPFGEVNRKLSPQKVEEHYSFLDGGELLEKSIIWVISWLQLQWVCHVVSHICWWVEKRDTNIESLGYILFIWHFYWLIEHKEIMQDVWKNMENIGPSIVRKFHIK